MHIKEGTSEDISKILIIRKRAYLKNHFSSTFSSSFLSIYYSYLVRYADFFLILSENNKPVAYLLAGKDINKGVIEFISLYKVKLYFHLLIHPFFLYDYLIDKLFDKSNDKSKAAIQLFDIAVDPMFQRNGYAKKLILALEHELKRSDISVTNYGLTVRKLNKKALAFYLNNGFQIEFTRRNSVQMIKFI